jgi:hypothetical protein
MHMSNTTPAHLPQEYKYIRAWGIKLQSYTYYITLQQEQASREGAPLTAVYYNANKWVTLEECSAQTQQEITALTI